VHRHLHYINANLHVSRLGLAFLNQNRTIAVASLVSADLLLTSSPSRQATSCCVTTLKLRGCRQYVEQTCILSLRPLLFAVPENVYRFVGVRRMRSYRGGWVDVMADVARISVKKQSVEDCLHHVVVEEGLACWAEAWREMLLYVVCWVNST
jgi:hypothetical protein